MPPHKYWAQLQHVPSQTALASTFLPLEMEENMSRRVVDLSNDDLANAGLLGDGECFANRVSWRVNEAVEAVRAHPELLSGKSLDLSMRFLTALCLELTLLMLECQNLASRRPDDPPHWAPFSQISSASDPVDPHLVSEFERIHYWHGISLDPPELLYRSDLESNPYPVPVLAPGTHWFAIPAKTAEGVFETPLNAVWHLVAPMIVALLKKRRIKYSALKTARFSTRGEDRKKTLGPIVIWIATHPNTTSFESARDASPDILHILKEHKVEGAVVEWYEGSVEKLSGEPLFRVTKKPNAPRQARRPLTVALGVPIAAKERQHEDARGTISFFFHETQSKNGQPSPRVLAVSNKHVLQADVTTDYKFTGRGRPRQYIRVCGERRFERFLDDARGLIAANVARAVQLAQDIVQLEEGLKIENLEETEDDEDDLGLAKGNLKRLEKENRELQVLLTETEDRWNDIARRTIGFVDWAPSISIDVDSHNYTRDIGTIELNPQRFKDNFIGNVVDLGNRFDSCQLNTMFYPGKTNPDGIKFDSSGLLAIRGVVEHKQMVTPSGVDENGIPVFIVGKDGNSTDFTVGRYSGLEAHLCDLSGKRSVEMAVYNYDKQSGNFSEKGDSGALIFTGDGRMLAVLHSGMGKGFSSHVSYGTPAWWVIEQLKTRYPHADFNRTTFFDQPTAHV
ncbi:transmembrane protein [Ceratobasidium sp. AG-Ba]|nr:transmembrane protein [Ceratobasidium sp. AG-Ba]